MEEIKLTQGEIKWVWRNYIPESNVTVLAAKGGVGKSAFALWLAGELAEKKLNTLYLDYERTARHIATRYYDWKYPERGYTPYIHFPAEPDSYTGEIIPTAPEVTEISAIVRECKAKLVVIDSMTSFFDQYSLIERGATTKFFKSLQATAATNQCGILLLAHVNKDPLPGVEMKKFLSDTITGSAAVRDLSKSVMGMVYDAEAIDGRIIQHVKHNLTIKQPDIKFDMDEFSMPVNLSYTDDIPTIKRPATLGTKLGRFKDIMIKALAKDNTLSKKQLQQLIKDAPGGNPDYATKTYKELINEGYIIE